MAKAFSARRRADLRQLLIDARQKAGLTQTALGKKLGRTQSFVSKVEKGDLRIDVVEFVELARAIGVDPARVLNEWERGGR